ncbi:MAG TPA: hypothetical protein G4O14_01665 [Anaerolineae bacterium]|nr:hypothetical protein [Anaerolineae bacterium]
MTTKDGDSTRQPYRVDAHHHGSPKLYFEALERLGKTTIFGVTLLDWLPETHLEVMGKNKMGVGMASIPTPGIQFKSDALSRDFARQCNGYRGFYLGEYPNRFSAFAERTVHLDTVRTYKVI